MKAKSGGGIQSTKVVHSTNLKREPIAKAVSPEAAAQLGRTVDFARQTTVGGGGPGYPSRPVVNTAKSGPGSNRVIYPRGQQGQHGPANPGVVSRSPDPSA